MSEQPTEQQLPTNSSIQDEHGWDRVAQEMHAWHPGLQVHARRHLEERGLLHLVASSDSEGHLQQGTEKHDPPLEQTSDASINVPLVRRIVRPRVDSTVESPTETKIIAGPEGIYISDACQPPRLANTLSETVWALSWEA